MRRSSLLTGSLCLTLVIAGYACGSSTGDSGSTSQAGSGEGGSSHAASGSGAGGSADAGDESLFHDHGKVVSLAVTPGTGTLDVVNGVASPQQFTATATFEDATTASVDADWSFDRLQLGLVDGQGIFTPSGTLGGKGNLTATYDGVTANAVVSVILHYTANSAGLSAADQAAFASPDGDPSGTLLYPQDATVFARGLLAPEIMWEGGAPGDSYLVHLHQDSVDVALYVTADPPSRATIPPELWTALTESNAGEPLTLDVQRLSAGTAHQVMHESWTVAQGSLRGSIYYWAVNTGQLMKIAPGGAAPSVVFDSGPADQLGTPAAADYNGTMPPWESGGNNKRCVACHTVSKDGSSIAAVFEKNGSTASPWGTVDLTAPSPSVLQMASYASTTIYLGLSPDGAHAVHNDLNFTFGLADAKTGAAVPSLLDSFTQVADPAFSPDGKLMAFASNVVGYYPVEYTQADLEVVDFDGAAVAFSNRRPVISGSTGAIAFPSFTPDSQWILYQSGDYSRAKYGTNSTGHDDLYITDVAGQVGSIPLATASGAGLSARNQHISYQPTANPISVGGYTWVVFVSPRDYGNRLQSTADPTYENRKQLWVAAIDQNPQPGKDPSHPAFWLPGQDLTTINMSGYWALEACHQTGTSCDEGFECCTGFCHSDGNGGGTCVDAPSGCSKIGDKCTSSADCCAGTGATCVGGFCATPPPQ